MSTIPLIEIDKDTQVKQQALLGQYLRGEKTLDQAADAYSSLSDFLGALTSEASARDRSAADKKSKESVVLRRLKAVTALGCARDTKYAAAGRRYLMAVGYNQRLRRHFNTAMQTAIHVP